MAPSLRRLKLGLILLGLLLTVWPLPPAVSPWFFALAIVLTGIPHGALDHVLYRNYRQGPAWQVNLRFYGEYFASIALFAVLWWAWPQAAAVGFILISAYHFGQTQLAYLQPNQVATYSRYALYMLWGLLAIGGFVMANSQVLDLGFTSVVPIPNVEALPSQARPYLEWGACLLILAMTIYLHRQPHDLLLELTELCTLALVFLRNDFYTSFGLFFGGWHALNAIHHMYRDIKRFEHVTMRKLIIEAIPHSVASLGGIGLLVWAATQWQTGLSPQLLLFMSLSVLAFPHIVVLQQWYRFLHRQALPKSQLQALSDPTSLKGTL